MSKGTRVFGLIIFIATLALATDSGAASRRSRRVSLELVSVPNIAYSGEETSLCFRVKNKGYFTAQLSCRQSVRVGGAVVMSRRLRLEIKGRKEEMLLMPLDMTKFRDKRGSIEISLRRAGTGDSEIARRKVIVRPAGVALSDLKAKIGHFEDANGDRIIICTDWEDPAKYRRWAWAKWLKVRSSRSPKNILLYGDGMETGLDDSVSYVRMIRDSVRQKGGEFTFIERASGLSPIISDFLRIDSLMKEADPAPDVVILSFGLADIRKSTPKSDYARAIDVIIDRIRLRKSNSQRIILVSPPPLASQVELSSSYTDAALKVARDHHVAFVDLHRLLCGMDLDLEHAQWSELYYSLSKGLPSSEVKGGTTSNASGGRTTAGANSSQMQVKGRRADVLYLYPNTPGQTLIAEAIIGEIY